VSTVAQNQTSVVGSLVELIKVLQEIYKIEVPENPDGTYSINFVPTKVSDELFQARHEERARIARHTNVCVPHSLSLDPTWNLLDSQQQKSLIDSINIGISSAIIVEGESDEAITANRPEHDIFKHIPKLTKEEMSDFNNVMDIVQDAFSDEVEPADQPTQKSCEGCEHLPICERRMDSIKDGVIASDLVYCSAYQARK